MKLSVAIASGEAPASAFVVWRGFKESIAKAAKFGYHGVELAFRLYNKTAEIGYGRKGTQALLLALKEINA